MSPSSPVSHSLFYNNPMTSLIKYGGSNDGNSGTVAHDLSIHHNVYTKNGERNPQIRGGVSADLVSNIVGPPATIIDFENGQPFSKFGTMLWNSTSSGEGPPGNLKVNITNSAYLGSFDGGPNGCGGGGINICTEAGASASGIFLSGNQCDGGCPASPAGTANAVPSGAQVTPTPVSGLKATLAAVGAPNRTATDQAQLDGVAALLGGAAPTPSLSINDVSLTEGNSGTKLATFTVTLSAASTSTVTVNYATANGSATAGSDYVATSGTLTFAAGTTTKTLSVTVNGDTTGEPDETFLVNLSVPSGATIADAQGIGTILNDDSLPTISINDVSVTEGNSGTKPATFTLTLSAASASPVSVTYATANGTASAPTDYAALGGTVTFPAGTTTQTLSVLVNGDTTAEPNETFTVNLSGASGATIARAQGTGTIVNDDAATSPSLSIGDVSILEGNSGTKNAAFVVTLTPAATSTVTVNYATANGTATAGSDYVAKSGTLSFPAGTTTQTIAVVVNGDAAVEPDETFTVNLTGASGATIARAQAVGAIVNDDTSVVLGGPLPVVWTSLVKVTVSGDSLIDLAPSGTDAGAASTRQFTSGDGYVQFTASETTTYRIVGLNSANPDASYNIPFGIALTPGAQMYVVERGQNRGAFGTYRSGDVLRVAVVGGVVTYSRNGTVFYKSTTVPTYPLRVDTWLYSTGATIKNVMFTGAQ